MIKTELNLVQFDLTDECPLLCRHCSNSSGPHVKSGLLHKTVERAILDAINLGCRNFVFSGGEPLCYVDLPRLLSACHEYRVSPAIFTTGIRDKSARLPLSDEDWGKLKALGLGKAIFSLYSGPANRTFHNHVVRLRPLGMRDAFEANEVGILRARDAGISVEVQFVPSDETCSELGAIASWAIEIGVSQLHLQYPTSQGRNEISQSLMVTNRYEPTLRAQALSLSQENGSKLHISRLWRSKWGIPSETALSAQIIIRSDGFAVRCNACKYIVESASEMNIYQNSVQQIWGDANWRNALCECSTQRVRKTVAASGRSSLQIVRAHDLLAPGTE